MSKKQEKVFFWAIVVVGLIWLRFFSNWNLVDQELIVIVFGVIFLMSVYDKRFKRLENTLGVLAEKPSAEIDGYQKPLSYRMELILDPNWEKIITDLAEEQKTEPKKFVKEILSDKDLKIKEGAGLVDKVFRFVVFHDSLSGLEQIWSDYHKTFLPKEEVTGHLFSSLDGAFDFTFHGKYENNRIGHSIKINPNEIGFPEILPDRELTSEEKLSEIPFGKIIQFLISLEKNIGGWGAMNKIKKFPNKLADDFKEHDVVYDGSWHEDYGTGVEASQEIVVSEWAKQEGVEVYDQKLREHVFISPYLTIRISIEFFD